VSPGTVTRSCAPAAGPPCRRVQELAAVSVTELAPGRHVADFGQNSNGWIRLRDLGPADTRLALTYGECLDAAGDVTQDTIKDTPLAPQRAGVPFQTDVVVSAGDGGVFEPRHSTKGFRYVRIDGHPGPLNPADISSIVVHTDLRRIGAFECSDERINRLHQTADWSFRANACEIPTDCPTRERSGWTGDWQIFAGTAAYLYDVTDFSANWLHDLAADQRADGAVTHIVPDPAPDSPVAAAIRGSAGWGDAAVHVPWELYLATGSTGILVRQYESMKRWVDFAAARAAADRHPTRIARRPVPLPYESYLWDTGWHFGEWLEPGTDTRSAAQQLLHADHGPVATAYLHRSAGELSAIAAILGDAVAAARYADHGYLDLAYELLFQDTPPSWLAMIRQGATTIWESWEAVRDDGTTADSLNHYSKGAVISFLHRYTAGLQILEPGYRRFRVVPRPGGGITSARTHHDSPHGRIQVTWSLTDRHGRLDLTVPDGTEADLRLPDRTTATLGPGTHHLTWAHLG
jgi:Bacterial alpha-L-rhamnosidase 6 hairpin glycosidase domain/Bacterial alpha-L-rhamnosidase C-terminal domain/Bacterial alpha-L-rhamnosidase concanavalin-like domain